MAVLHYIYDPLCGWCYGAAPLLAAAATIPGLEIELHGGGMLVGAHRPSGSPSFRGFVVPHAQRITQLTGRSFGAAYLDGLLNDSSALFDSEPPTAAILAAGSRGVAMLAQIQKAQFEDGRPVWEHSVLEALADELDIDDFRAAFGAASSATAEHMAQGRQLLSIARGQGFPTFYLSTAERLEHGPFLGNPAGWRAHVEEALGKALRTSASRGH